MSEFKSQTMKNNYFPYNENNNGATRETLSEKLITEPAIDFSTCQGWNVFLKELTMLGCFVFDFLFFHISNSHPTLTYKFMP